MTLQIKRKLFTTNEYDQMIAAGIFTETDRFELLEGEIVEMSPIGMRHAACVKRINQIFVQRLAGQAIIGVQDPVHLDAISEPEPDVSILRPRTDFYATSHPQPSDILFLVEVAETSLFYDQNKKLPLYALAGIKEVWIVDVDAKTVTAYCQPTDGKYEETAVYHPSDSISPQAFPDLHITVKDIVD